MKKIFILISVSLFSFQSFAREKRYFKLFYTHGHETATYQAYKTKKYCELNFKEAKATQVFCQADDNYRGHSYRLNNRGEKRIGCTVECSGMTDNTDLKVLMAEHKQEVVEEDCSQNMLSSYCRKNNLTKILVNHVGHEFALPTIKMANLLPEFLSCIESSPNFFKKIPETCRNIASESWFKSLSRAKAPLSLDDMLKLDIMNENCLPERYLRVCEATTDAKRFELQEKFLACIKGVSGASELGGEISTNYFEKSCPVNMKMNELNSCEKFVSNCEKNIRAKVASINSTKRTFTIKKAVEVIPSMNNSDRAQEK